MADRVRETSLPERLFCDASFLIAYFAPRDRDHPRARRLKGRFKGHPLELFTSWPTVSEATTILLYHYGYSNATALLRALSAFHIMVPSEGDYYQAQALFGELNRDQKLSFNDCLTCALIRGSLGNMTIATFDRDFVKVGLTVLRP